MKLIKSNFACIIIFIAAVDCRIKVEESKFWPIAPNVPVEYLDRD